MTRPGLNEFADPVIRDLWMKPVPLGQIALLARMSIDEVLDRVPHLGLPPRKPPERGLNLARIGHALRGGHE